MSNQIVISSGAKVRSLEGVLTGTAGIVNSVPLGGANGVATLDSLGKVPLSQLPASVVTYLGTWNAATNTPTLTNGVGDVGDLYICNVAGTVNFGAGPITFAVGDWVIYSGTEWQKSSGASGTVTSVAVTESGDALTITGSPITTSGTINIGFAGTGSQYIKGDGTLATFPTTIDQAKRLITEVYNSTGATLTKGTVVYINGGQGNLPTVTKAQANADNTSAQTYGVVQSDITNNNNGFVVVIGSLTDIDTQAYAVGTQLYLSGTTAGDWTSTKPSAPIHLVYVGIVVRSHPTQGVVEIRIQNGYELEELHDVAISAPLNNQGIFYNSSNDLWENKSIATALGYTPANDALVVHLAGTETITGIKTFSNQLIVTGAGLFDNGFLLKDGATTVASGYFNIASLNSTTLGLISSSGRGADLVMPLSGQSYQLPNASGTLALTSDLGNYVTLATTQTITGAKIFTQTTAVTGNLLVRANSGNIGQALVLEYGTSGTGVNALTGVAMYVNAIDKLDILFTNQGTSSRSARFVGSSITNNSTREYTLPDASGTLALTSNLSSYVPYTGATTNVDLGSNFLKARTFYSEGSGGGGSYAIKNGTTPSFEDGYTILSSNDYRLNIVSTVSAATKAVYFGFSGVTATRTYTLPDASGTLALTSNLSSYVPYTGATGAVDLGNYDLTVYGIKVGRGAGSISTNIVLGASALSSNTTGSINTAIGTGSLQANTTGSANTAIGNVTLNSNLTGQNNTAIGNTALSMTTSSYNTGIGAGSLANNTSGSYNTGLGYGSGSSITTGSYNVIIGSYTGTSGMSNNIILADGQGNIRYQWNGTTNNFTGSGTFSGDIRLDNGSADGAQLVLASSGFSDWNIDNFSGNFRWYYGSTERMRLTNAGNLAIGTTSPITFTNYNTISVNGSTGGAVVTMSNGTSALRMACGTTDSALWEPRNVDFAIGTNNTERMRISSSGQVGINTSTMSGNGSVLNLFRTPVNSNYVPQLTFQGLGNYPNMQMGTFDQYDGYIATIGSDLRILSGLNNTTENRSMMFYTTFNGASGGAQNYERMRINPNGRVSVNNAIDRGYQFMVSGDVTSYACEIRQSNNNANYDLLTLTHEATSGNRRMVIFNAGGYGTVGTIISTNSSTTYNTNSDYRLKEDLKEFDGLAKVSAIKVYDFKWKIEDARMDGVLAHELAEILPYAVYGEKDAVDENDKPVMQSVDYSKLVPVLVKAIQELNAKVTALENK